MFTKCFYTAILLALYCQLAWSYSTIEDARLIAEYKRNFKSNSQPPPKDLTHATIARKLVHNTNWASVGTISTNSATKGFPMVNVISINDNDVNQKSTGRIQFLLTDMDFTGLDWQSNRNATFLFSNEQNQVCSGYPRHQDPMEPSCERAMITGHIIKVNSGGLYYEGETIISYSGLGNLTKLL